MTASEGQHTYFKNLDAIRFIAAMMVLLGHTVRPVYLKSEINSSFLFNFLQMLCNGEIGVSIFFVLSGFLITHLLLKEYEKHKRISIKNFYMRRVLRIWPLYYAVVLFSFFIYPAIKTLIDVNNPLASSVGYHLLFLSNFDVIHIQKFFPGRDALSQNITWSVSVEEQFYLIWPLIFVILPKKIWPTIIILIIGLSMLFRFLNHEDNTILYFHTFSVLVDLAVGGLFALAAFKVPAINNFFISSGSLHHTIFISLSVLLIYFSPQLMQIRYMEAFIRIILAVIFAFMICGQAFSERRSLLNFSNWHFGTKWGKYTYGIYLLHSIVLTLTDATLRAAGLESSHSYFLVWVAGITIIVTFILSKLSYRYFESKFLLLKRSYNSLQPAAEEQYGKF